ncbi:MAG: glycoside hydrolase family 3 N-terminal domain-containing protein [Bacteroidota bacterium]|nr:glycoside hydrolase family 3 N-terminal domain-containing protein [Bacteroidota bacterium]
MNHLRTFFIIISKVSLWNIFNFSFFLFIFLFGCRAPIEIEKPHEEPTPIESKDVQEIFEAKTDWVEAMLKRLSLEEKIGQMIMPRATGYFVNSQTDEYQKMMRLVKDRKVGGFCFFQGDVYATAVTVNQLQQFSDVPLLISADFERGGPMRIRRMTPFPEAMAVGAAGRTDLASKMGEIVAAESRAIGVYQNFAPVVDININPNNPVINIRSYGESPKLVAEIATAYAQGMQAGGVIATAKHFPGHGDTDVDSHYDLPKLSVSRNRLDSVELYPFKYLIDKGVMSVMTAHLEVPALEKEKRLPASISRSITTNLLKNEFGFKGLIVTDALEMKGVTKVISIDETAIRAVEAGVDILLLPPDEDVAIEAIIDAVLKGRISESRIDSSVTKILAIKQWLKLDENRLVDLNKVSETVSKPEHWQIAKQIAQASITVAKNEKVIPLQPRKKTMLIIISDTDDYRTDINRSSNPNLNERAGDYLLSQIRTRRSGVQTIRLSPRSNKIDFGAATSLARAADVVVFALYAKTRTRANPYGIPQNLIDFINSLTNGSSASTNYRSIILSFGNPYVVGTIKNPNTVMCTFSDGELSTEAAVEVLFGETEAKGRLPVTIPPMYAFGSGIVVAKSVLHDEKAEATFSESKFVKVSKVIQKAIQDNAFPGAQLVVVKKGEILLNKNFGTLDYSPNAKEITDSTLYDIASLTKVVGTTSAIMKLYDEGKINLDEKVVTYVPEFGNSGKDKITVRNLLLHNSGLPAWQKFYLTCNTSSEVLDSIYNSKLIYKTGDSTVYSDFGFIILGKIIERITGLSLDTYLRTEFFEPLGMMNTFYNPPVEVLQRTAPTELDTTWRKKLIHGTVHDETAALLGGVAGHAGLFSTASDLAVFVQMIMNGGVQYIKPETIKLFTERKNLKTKLGLGWDFKTLNGYSSAGNLLSNKSFGHTGFTGTSIWIDPERNLFVIFLTNRVYPTRANNKIAKVRPALHDAVVEALK